MTPKLTDEQIMKALECCSKSDCENCNRQWSYVAQWDCMRHIMRLSLDLINRINCFADIGKMYSEIRAEAKTEAYKEFAEILKKHGRKMCSSDFSGEFWDYAVLVEDIDNLLKEMKGE